MNKSTYSDGAGRRLTLHAVRMRELCEMLGVSRSTAYSLLRNDPLMPKGFLVSPRARVWMVGDVIAFLEARSGKAVTQHS